MHETLVGPALPSIAADEGRAGRYVWYVIGLLSVVNACSYMDRMALSVLTPAIKLELHLSDGQIGLLTGLAFSLFYAVCGLPLARWADRGIRRDIVVLALATWSVMTALSGAALHFWSLFAARVGIGAGEAGCFPAAASLICDYVPLKKRSGAFALHTFGGYVGLMAGMMLAGALAERIGWRWTFLALGLPGIALAATVRLTLREPARGVFEAKNPNNVRLPLGPTIAVLWGCRTYRLLMLSFVQYGFIQYGMNQWWPSFYTRTFGLNLSVLGFRLGIAIAAGSAIGLLLGGLLANRFARQDLKLPLKIGAVAIVLSIPAALAALFVRSASVSLLLVSLTTLCWTVSNGPVAANINSVVSASMRATANSIAVFAMSVLGFSLGPLCVGLLSDRLTSALGTQALRYALIAPICLIPVMAATLFEAAKTLPYDLRAAGAQSADAAPAATLATRS